MTEEDQGPPPLCFINAKGPTAIESPARPGQMDQVANADVLVGSEDEITTHHGDKSNDLIWETLKRFKCRLQACNMIFRVLPQNVGQDHGRCPPPDHEARLDLGPDGCLMIEVGTIGTVVVQNMMMMR